MDDGYVNDLEVDHQKCTRKKYIWPRYFTTNMVPNPRTHGSIVESREGNNIEQFFRTPVRMGTRKLNIEQ